MQSLQAQMHGGWHPCSLYWHRCIRDGTRAASTGKDAWGMAHMQPLQAQMHGGWHTCSLYRHRCMGDGTRAASTGTDAWGMAPVQPLLAQMHPCIWAPVISMAFNVLHKSQPIKNIGLPGRRSPHNVSLIALFLQYATCLYINCPLSQVSVTLFDAFYLPTVFISIPSFLTLFIRVTPNVLSMHFISSTFTFYLSASVVSQSPHYVHRWWHHYFFVDTPLCIRA